MSENHWDEPFLRSVALLQAQGQAIEGQAGQLSDLADMQAQRRLKSDLAEYISAHAAAGTLPRDPLEVAEARLERLAKFLSQADDVRTEILNSHRSLLGDGIPSVTKANLEEALFEVAVMRQSLPAQLEALRQQSSQLDWVSDLRGADVHPELLICANILEITLPDTVLKRVNLWAFVRGAGDDFEAVQRRLNQIRQRAEQLLVLHESHRLILAEAESNVALGNHLSALNSLSRCGGTNQENFSDLPYPVLRKRAALFSERVVTITRTAGDLIHGSAKTTDTFERLASTGEAKRALKSAQAELLSLQRRREADAAETAALSGSEFENKCKPSLEAARENLVKANETLTKLAAIGAAKRFRTLTVFIVSLIFVVAAAIAFGFWKQEQNKIAAKASAEKRLEWTGKAMQRAGFKEETLKRTLTQGGTVVAWGKNDDGQTTVPAGLSGVVAIAAGWYHTVALKQDGTVVAWGYNSEGQTKVPAGLSGVVAIAAGYQHTVALKQDGTVVAWGENDKGQTRVPAGLSGVVAIAAGTYHTVALKQDGTVVAWGSNKDFEGKIVGQSTVPAGLSGVVAIAAGGAHTVALKQDGTVVAWGENDKGQTRVPAGLSGVVAIAAGAWHTVALKQDGTVVAWGFNSDGQTTVPAGLSGVVAIAAGAWHTVALKQDGTVVAWGENDNGQTRVPAGLSGVVAIAAGGAHTVALKLD